MYSVDDSVIINDAKTLLSDQIFPKGYNLDKNQKKKSKTFNYFQYPMW